LSNGTGDITVSKNLIYQYWDGEVRPSAQYGSDCMKAYAEKIGADYIFDLNANFGKKFGLGRVTPYYGCFKPVFDDAFLEYDNVMFADTDIFPLDKCDENIFDTFTGELAMATEPLQTQYRFDPKLKKQCNKVTELTWSRLVTEKYGCEIPLDPDGRPKVYNSGVVLYSNAGLRKCREQFEPFLPYVEMVESDPSCRGKVYGTDQGYLHAMACSMDIDFVELDNEWNRYITWCPYDNSNSFVRTAVDPRTKDTKMVHIQMRGADNQSNAWHHTIANKPKSDWPTMNNGTSIV
jgi:hypothetical protein